MPNAPKLGIIAGGGTGPLQLMEACRKAGRPYFLICLEGHADPGLPGENPHMWAALGAFDQLRQACRAQNIEEIVMVGRVRRPSIAELKPDGLALKVLGKIGLNLLGDDGLLRGVSKAIEDECGVRVIGAHEVFADLLAPKGVLGPVLPMPQDQADITLGMKIAAELGRLDIGQAVVVQQGLVLGVEAIEGTDALIARAGGLKRGGGGGVLVKRSKPQQDTRYDLPAIGPDTIAALARAGFAGVAVEAGRSLLLEREKTLEAAKAAGLFVVGVEA